MPFESFENRSRWSFYPIHTIAAAVAWGAFYLSALVPWTGRPMLTIPLVLLLILAAAEGAFSRTVRPTADIPWLITVGEILVLSMVLVATWVLSRGIRLKVLFSNPVSALHPEILIWVVAVGWVWQLAGVLAADQATAVSEDFAGFAVDRFTRRLFRLTMAGVAAAGVGGEASHAFGLPGQKALLVGSGMGAVVLTLALLGRLNLKRKLHVWGSGHREVDHLLPVRWIRLLSLYLIIALALAWILPNRFSPLTLNEAFDRIIALMRPDEWQPAPELNNARMNLLLLDKLGENKVLNAVSIFYGVIAALMFLAALVQGAFLVIFVLYRCGSNMPDWLERMFQWCRRQWARLLWWLKGVAGGLKNLGRDPATSGWLDYGCSDPASGNRPNRSWKGRSGRHLIRYLFYDVVNKAAKQTGPYRQAETPGEYGRRLANGLTDQSPEELAQLTVSYEWARYSEDEPDARQVRSARQAWGIVVRALSRAKPHHDP